MFLYTALYWPLCLCLCLCTQEWADRAHLPAHVVTMLKNFPANLHPMAQFAAAVTACNSESKFVKAYSEGVKKTLYWEVLANH